MAFPSSMPYDSVEIIDQSGYTDEIIAEAPYIPAGPIAFIPFVSPRGYGEDNKLQYMTGAKLAKYGSPNLKKYGLSLYLANRFIAGGGTVLGMRVTDDDWTLAFKNIYASITKATKPRYKISTNSITGKTLYNPVFTNSDGEYAIPELTVKFNDDGTYGLALSTDPDVALTPIESSESGGSVELSSVFTVTLNGTAVDVCLSDTNKITEVTTSEGSASISSSSPSYTVKTNSALVVKYTATNTGTSGSSVQMTRIPSTSSYSDMTSMMLSDSVTTVSNIKIATVCAKGAGKYGNNFRFRIALDDDMNSYNETTNKSGFFYKFIDSDGDSKMDPKMSFTFNEDYVYNGESMYIEEVFRTYTDNIVMVDLGGIEVLKANLKAIDASMTDEELDNVDYLFGSNINSDVYFVDRFSTGTVDLASNNGIQLSGGSETSVNFNWSASGDPFAKILAKAYNGEISDAIYDQVKYPYQFIFAPSQDGEVLDAIHNLVTVNRKFTRAHYFVCDTDAANGVPESYSKARTLVSNVPADNWKEDVIPEWARITDPYTSRKVFMPSVYFTAYTMPLHWNNRKGKPLAGRLNATWTGFDVGTVTPRSSNVNEYISNHNAGMNTMVEDGLGSAVMYEQITAQRSPSRLSEINNAQTLCEMVKIAVNIADSNRWSDLGDDEISVYRETVESAINIQLNGCYQNMTVVATRESSNGAGRNRILCSISVLFKDMLKGVTYQFYILAE